MSERKSISKKQKVKIYKANNRLQTMWMKLSTRVRKNKKKDITPLRDE
jgi:hypothetical protein